MATVSDVTFVPYSGDHRVDALLYKPQFVADWNYVLPSRNTLYYTFDLGLADSQMQVPVSAFNAAQKAATQAILNYVTSITGINFSEVSSASGADFHFRACDIPGANVTGICDLSNSVSQQKIGRAHV